MEVTKSSRARPRSFNLKYDNFDEKSAAKKVKDESNKSKTSQFETLMATMEEIEADFNIYPKTEPSNNKRKIITSDALLNHSNECLDDKSVLVNHKSAKATKLRGEKSGRKWINVNPNQKMILDLIYEETNYPDLKRKEEIASQLGLETKRVSLWFDNKRKIVKSKGISNEKKLDDRNCSQSLKNEKDLTPNNTAVEESESQKNLTSLGIVKENTSFNEQIPKVTTVSSVDDSDRQLDSIREGVKIESAIPEVGIAEDDTADGLLDDFKLQADRLWKTINSSSSKILRKCLRPANVADVSSLQGREKIVEDQHSKLNPEKLKSQTKRLQESSKSSANSECFSSKEQLPRPKKHEEDTTDKEPKPSSEVLILREQIKALKRRQIELESHNTQLYSRNMELKKVNHKLSEAKAKSGPNDNSDLERVIADLNKQHQNDEKTISEAENLINSLIDKIKIKNVELSQLKLSEESKLLELNKLEEVNKFQEKNFKQIRTTLELVLDNDSKFCKIDQVEKLTDSDVVEYVNSILVEFKDIKKRHFTDVQNCIFKLQTYQQQKDKFKKRVKRLLEENGELNNGVEELKKQLKVRNKVKK